jgi:hypothetical protein
MFISFVELQHQRPRTLAWTALTAIALCGACTRDAEPAASDAGSSSPSSRANVSSVDVSSVDVSSEGGTSAAEAGIISTQDSEDNSTLAPEAGLKWSAVVSLPDSQPGYIGAFDVAAAGELGFVVYRVLEMRASAIVGSHVGLQRLDAAGAPLGDELTFDTRDGEPGVATVTVATDGANAVACWQSNEQFACVPVNRNGANVRGVRYFDGVSPKIVFTGNNWVIAYLSADGESIVLEALDATLATIGEARELPAADTTEQPVMSGRDGNVALIAASSEPDDENAYLYRLDSELEAQRPAVSLGRPSWMSASVATLGERAVVSVAAPYTGFLTWVDEADELTSVEIAGGGKNGNSQQIEVAGEGFLVAWFDSATHIATEVVDGPLSGTRADVVDIRPSLRLVTVGETVFAVSHRAADPEQAAVEVTSKRSLALRPLL